MDIGGKCAVVTGGSSGIGKEIAKLYAQRGANVFLIARREDVLKEAIDEVKKEGVCDAQKFGYCSADVSDLDSVQNAINTAEAECGAASWLHPLGNVWLV